MTRFPANESPRRTGFYWSISAKSSFYLPAFEISRSCSTASGVFKVHYYIFRGRRYWGFLLFDIASLVMYCNDASLRIVTKSLYRTAPPFSILNGAAIRWRETTPHQPIQAEQIPAFPLSRSLSYVVHTLKSFHFITVILRFLKKPILKLLPRKSCKE